MPVQPPKRDRLEWIAASFHMTLTEEELDEFTAAAGPALAGYRRLDELPDEHLPVRYPRADLGRRPIGEDGLDPRQVGVRTQPYVEALEPGAAGLRIGVLAEGFGIPDASDADVDSAVRAAAEELAAPGAATTRPRSSSPCCSAPTCRRLQPPLKARPIPVGGGIPDVLAAALGSLHNASPFDVTGNPALSVPCGMSDGLPIGMMLVGRHFDDATVLRAGHAYLSRTTRPATPAAGSSAAR